MKTILCYGDSLTWGHDAETDGRHAYEDRWPSMLAAGLSGQARVIAEGLGGRTTAYDDGAANADRNGARILPVLLASHAPLDLVVLMLGSNDLKPGIQGSALAASYGTRRLIEVVRGHFVRPGDTKPAILVVSPPHVVGTANLEYEEMFTGAIEQSQLLAPLYRALADEYRVAFFDAAPVARATPLDGVHLDAQNTRAIGTALVPVVKRLLGLGN